MKLTDRQRSILAALAPAPGKPGIQIIRDVEAATGRPLDPSTLHHELHKLCDAGLAHQGRAVVTVPKARGATAQEPRAVYIITRPGQAALIP
jgi:DNA-binding PadR family transcriptional regulator